LEEDTEACQVFLPKDSDKAWTATTRQSKEKVEKAVEEPIILLRMLAAEESNI
jgi:hypothetical protein